MILFQNVQLWILLFINSVTHRERERAKTKEKEKELSSLAYEIGQFLLLLPAASI